jgi:dTDP-4-dehydrorhamnose 3,5-epimerase
MEVEPLPIRGAYKIIPRVFSDDRGSFKEIFSATRYAQFNATTFTQDNVSSSKRHTLRGLHADPRMSKLVQVLRGSAFDVLVDLRRDSPTYRMCYSTELRATEHTQLYIPAGCLHGFLALEDDTLLLYKQTAEYDPTAEYGVAWNDPDLEIDWPLNGAAPLLSPKDAANPTLRELGHL